MEGIIESKKPWKELASDYEFARSREDSLDRLIEWPAQKELLGDVKGKSFLDLGCGNGEKLAELVANGAVQSFGIDVRGDFVSTKDANLEYLVGDLSDFSNIPELHGKSFDRVMFLQSFGYAQDPVNTLKLARNILNDDGFILLTRTQPIRYALERTEKNGTTLGDEYFSKQKYSYSSNWSDKITLTKRPYTMSDLLNSFSAAGLWIDTVLEPQLSEADRTKYPHKKEWMDKYLGILVFKLRPLKGI